jgi:hypothetical protein
VRWKPHDSLLPSCSDIDAIMHQRIEGAYARHGVFEVTVADDGVGLSPENLGNLFREGWQFDAKRLQAGQGSGLGLWISKKILDLHCGRIEAASAGDGQGTSMTFVLPLYRQQQSGEEDNSYGRSRQGSMGAHRSFHVVPKEEDSYRDVIEMRTANYRSLQSVALSSCDSRFSTADSTALEGMNILIADDSLICRKIVEKVLTAAGARCVLCANGQEVVNTVTAQENPQEVDKINLILLDYEVCCDT